MWYLCGGKGNSYTNDERMVVAGYDNGDVKMFDLRTLSVHHSTNVGNGVLVSSSVDLTCIGLPGQV